MRAAVYLRISSDPTGQQLGVSRQREYCFKLAKQHKWTPVEYLDNDVSASSGKRRPDYERMLADIRDGSIGAVVVWDLDRLHRRPIDLESFMALADEHRLALATVSGDVDLSTAQGRLVARLKGSVAAHEIEHKKARQRRAARQKAEQGRPQWTWAFGYLDDTRQPDPRTAPLVKRVYAHVLAGGSVSDGAHMLNAEGALAVRWVKPKDAEGNPLTDAKGNQLKPAPEYQPWSPSTLTLFLRKPRNAGLREHNGEIVGQGTWPALVDESTWRAAQSVLNAPGRAPGRKSVRRHLLTGVLQCGRPECDGYLSGAWAIQPHTGPRARSVIYACKRCHRVSVRAEHVEPLVYRLVSGRLAMADAVDLLRAEQFDPEEAKRLDDEKQSLYAQIRSAEAEYDDGVIDGRRLAGRIERVNQKLEAIERQRQDQEKLRVFDGLPLGTPEVADAVKQLSADHFRAVLDVLVTLVVAPVGKGGGKVFDPDRVDPQWKS